MLLTTAVTVFALTLPSALAAGTTSSSSSITALRPCGDGASTSPHAIVPDPTCQRISSTGAFTVAAVNLESGTRLGFSTTSDCAATYTPTLQELADLHQSQNCTVYAVKGSTKVKQDGHGPQKEKYVSFAGAGDKTPAEKQETAKEALKKPGGGDGFIIKRAATKHGDEPGAAQQPSEEQPVGDGQRLTYVMLVKSDD